MSKITPITNFTIVLRHLFLKFKEEILYLKVGSFWWRSTTSGFQSYIKKLSLINRAGFTSSIALFIIGLLIIFPIYYKTNLAEATGNLSDTTLSIISDNLTAGVDLLVTSDSGTFASSTSPMSFNVSTNNSTGYMLSISAKSGTDLTNSTAGTSFTSLDATNSTIVAGITADTFGNASNTAYNNQWGFKPSYYKSNANTDKFYPSPTVTGVTLNKTDSANVSGVSDIYTIAIGARATYSQPAGTYSNAYILNAVGNYPKYSFTYIDSFTSNTISTDTSAGTSTTATLATTPSKDNYEFKGWCTVNNSANPSTCTGTTYAAGASFSLSTLSANALNFYTIWEQLSYTITFKTSDATSIIFNNTTYTDGQTATVSPDDASTYSICGNYADRYAWSSWSATAGSFGDDLPCTSYTITESATITLTGQLVSTEMQNLSASACTTTAAIPVYDNRDNTTYWVQRLADGKCWMLDNLAFDAYRYKESITTINTNTDAISLEYFLNGGGTTSNRYAMSAVAEWTPDYTNSNSTPLIGNTDIGKIVTYAAGQPGYGKVGIYYNYCALTVGNYCYGNGLEYGNPSGDATESDICPAGWRTPTGNDSGEFNELYKSYDGSYVHYINTLRLLLSGYFDEGLAHGQNSYGYFWTSTYSNQYRMYDLSVYNKLFYGSYVNTDTHGLRYNGISVRCVMDKAAMTINFGSGIDSVIIKTTTPTGSTLATASTTGVAITVEADSKYYILPLYSKNYTLDSVINTGSTGTLTSGTYGYYYFVPDKGINNAVTISAKNISTTSSTNMQNLAYSSCPSYPYPVKDSRDNTVYYIQKLADGRCWMLENLALDITDQTTRNALTTSNTHVNATSLTSFKNGNRSAGNRYANGAFTVWESGIKDGSYSVAMANADSKAIIPSGTYGPGRGYIGVYYNFCAASAGSYCYGNGTSYGTSTSNSTYDICPSGWKLPLVQSSAGTYYYLYNTAYSANATNFSKALSLNLSGWFIYGSKSKDGDYGNFATSSRSGDDSMFSLSISRYGGIYTNISDNRSTGLTMRCVLVATS